MKRFWYLILPVCAGFLLGYITGSRYGGKIWQAENAPPEVQRVRTSVAGVRVSYYAADPPLAGWGGGLALTKDTILGVDRKGQFFTYQGQGKIQKLNVSLDTNEERYLDHLAQHLSDINARSLLERRFRVLDIATRDIDSRLEIYVSHNRWDEQKGSKTMRVSRLVLEDADASRWADGVSVPVWEVLYETDQIELDARAKKGDDLSPFHSDRQGGRMVFNCEGDLLVSIGDYNYDGFTNASMEASQDEKSSFGKIVAIDPDKLRAPEVYALGFRNPQGMYVDRDCRVWATEQGPMGGDELNLIIRGANYGWPRVTYGTAYGSYVWPLSHTQGRHEGFVKPQFAWVPSIAISSIIQIKSGPEPWRDNLLAGSLRAASLFRIEHEEGRIVFVEPISIGERIRDLVELPDGRIVLWTDSGRLVELEPTISTEQEFPVKLNAAEDTFDVRSALKGCLGCHAMSPTGSSEHDKDTLVAPGLWQIYGRKIANEDFKYTRALRSKGGTWDRETLNEFLRDPQRFAPGTTMPPPILKVEVRKAVVEYLSRLE